MSLSIPVSSSNALVALGHLRHALLPLVRERGPQSCQLLLGEPEPLEALTIGLAAFLVSLLATSEFQPAGLELRRQAVELLDEDPHLGRRQDAAVAHPLHQEAESHVSILVVESFGERVDIVGTITVFLGGVRTPFLRTCAVVSPA